MIDKTHLQDFVKKKAFWILWIAFLLFLFVQHKFVYMCYDDFGYATLTYGNYLDNVEKGADWNVSNLLDFLHWHYINWGGRVVYFFFLSLALRCGEVFIQNFQAVVFFMISIFSYLIVRRFDRDIFTVWLLIVAYCMISLGPMRDGFFWFTAAAIYVWPFVCLFGGILLFTRQTKSKKNLFLSAVMFFFAACSQEQVAVLTITFALSILALNFYEKRKLDKAYILILAVVLVGGAIEILAPGNFVRATSAESIAFYQTSLIEKFFKNIVIVLYIIFDSKIVTWSFAIMLLFVGLKIFSRNEQKSYWKALIIFNIATIFLLIASKGHIFHITYEQQGLMRFFFMSVFVAETTFYFFKQKQYTLIGLLNGAVLSQAMLIMSPTMSARQVVPFYVVMPLIFAYLFSRSLENKFRWIMLIFILVISFSAFTNAFEITKGYYKNSFVQELNQYKLREAASQITAGRKVENIILYRLPDDEYSNLCMPYNRDYEPLVKLYFKIPQDVRFIWNKFGATADAYEVVNFDSPKIENIALGEMDSSGLRIFVYPQNKGTVPLKIVVDGNVLETKQEEPLVTIIPKDILSKNMKIQLKNPATDQLSEIVRLNL